MRGERTDGQDFIEQWMDPAHGENRQYVWNKTALDNVDPVSTDRLLGKWYILLRFLVRKFEAARRVKRCHESVGLSCIFECNY